mmetsp:Transcript_16443/g.27897  ORF Transcript_16443/g.27897 Transcript_16443/m.27897 type:complete len:133 (+) Transcript_16443:1064-1462(+)
MKLFPLVAEAFAQVQLGDHVYALFHQFEKESQKNQDFKLLDILHHLTSGAKSVHSQNTIDGLILIRQSLGGAGYTAWSGIPRLIFDYSPVVTFEGDNTVMSQQSFNYLLKQATKAVQGKDAGKLEPKLKYLN